MAENESAPDRTSTRVEIARDRIEAKTRLDQVKTWRQLLALWIIVAVPLVMILAVLAMVTDNDAVCWGSLVLVSAPLATLLLRERRTMGGRRTVSERKT